MDMKARWEVKLNIGIGEVGRKFWASMNESGISMQIVHEHPSIHTSRHILNAVVNEKQGFSI